MSDEDRTARRGRATSKATSKPTGKGVKLGEGLLSWPRGERVTNRYGLVGLSTGRWDEAGEPMLDSERAATVVGKVGFLVATVTGPQRSSHVGDWARGLRQRAVPKKGAVVVLCTEPGELFLEDVDREWHVGIEPLTPRDLDWLIPEHLYDLHESKVVLTFHAEDA